jgi:hypothetical protein
VKVYLVEEGEDREQMYVRALATLSALITPIEMNSSTILPSSVVTTQACPEVIEELVVFVVGRGI